MRFIITGKSGVGKTTLQEIITDRIKGKKKLILTTTRSPRAGETEGVDFYFTDREHINVDYYEIATEFKGNLFLCNKNSFTSDCIAVLESVMVGQAQRLYHNTVVIMLKCSDKERRRRVKSR